jgi:putative ABC transport system substrate-binding protein
MVRRRISVLRMLRHAVWLLAGLHGADALAHDALVIGVLSRDSPPYREAVRGVSEVLSRFPGAEPRIVTLDEGTMMMAAGTIPMPGGTVIAFGQRAGELFPVTTHPSQITCMMLEASGKSGILLQHRAEARLQRMRRLLPQASTVGLLVAEGEPVSGDVRDFQAAARRGGMDVFVHAIDFRRPLRPQLDPLADHIDVLMATYDLRIHSVENAQHILLFSWRNRIPVIGVSEAWSRAGALMSFDWDYADIGRQCGELAARLPHGRGFSTPVVERVRRVAYSVNLQAARHFLINIPAELLQGARNRYN